MVGLNGRHLRAAYVPPPEAKSTRRIDKMIEDVSITLQSIGFSEEDAAMVSIATRAAVLEIVRRRRGD
jgi:hypothetical protein